MRSPRFLRCGVGLAAILCLLAFPGATRAYDYSYARVVRLSLVQGDVRIARPDRAGWQKAVMNMPVEQGFTIGTNDGRAEIEFEDGATAWIAENTLVQFSELALSNGGRITQLTLTQGTASFRANLAGGDSFSVLTPQLQVTLLQNAAFRLDAFREGASVSVYQGEVNVDSPAGAKQLNKGQALAYNPALADPLRIEPNPAPDEWDHWVQNRESHLSAGLQNARLYTSAPISYGLADLSSYGTWNYFSGFGYGWQPWGIGSGWAPFWDGYWALYPGLGWTWISYEPWGWVPYHFGSWVFSPAFGWIWLPGGFNYWCPSPVQWVQAGNRLGWTPLRPSPPPTPGKGQPTPPPPNPPQIGTVVVGNRGGIGNGTPHSILTEDQVNGRVRPLPGPPLVNGRIFREGTGNAVLGGDSILVPTASNTSRLQSDIAAGSMPTRFLGGVRVSERPAVAPQFVNSAPAPPAPAAIRMQGLPRLPEGRALHMPPTERQSPPPSRMEIHRPPAPPPPPRMEIPRPTTPSPHSFSAPHFPQPRFSAPRPSPPPAPRGGHPH